MPHPQHLRYQEGGTIFYDHSSLPTAATVRLVDADSTELLAHTAANISTINTALSAAANAGDRSFSVTANTGAAVGLRCWLQDDPEDVTIRKVAGTTIHTRRPVLHDHISGARVEGGRVSFDVNASVANALWWDGHAEWNIDSETYYTALECTRYGLDAKPTVQDLCAVEPKLYDILDAETDVDTLCENAMQYVLGKIAKASPDLRTRVFCGSMSFRRASSLAAMYLHYMRRRGGQELADSYRAAVHEELDAMTAVIPRDADQDKTIEKDERISMHTVLLRR